MATYFFDSVDELNLGAAILTLGPGDRLVVGRCEPFETFAIICSDRREDEFEIPFPPAPLETVKLGGDDTICAGPRGYDWEAANQAPRSARRRK